MIDFKKHLQKLSEETFDELLFEGNLLSQVKLYTQEWPKLPLGGLAILALPDTFTSPDNQSLQFTAAQAIRLKLYASAPLSFTQPITDLGNFTYPLADDEFATDIIQELLFHLLQHNHRLLLIGGQAEDAQPFINALKSLVAKVQVAYVNPIFAFSTSPIAKPRERFLQESKQLISNLQAVQIASQMHLNTAAAITPEQGSHQTYSLGQISSNILGAEPFLRDAVFHSFSVDSISRPFFKANRFSQAYGLSAHQFAQLAYYAGHSLENRIAHFADYQTLKDTDDAQDAQTLATAIWYFMDGANFLQSEGDFKDSSKFNELVIIDSETNMEVKFLKSKITGRVWGISTNDTTGELEYFALSKEALASNYQNQFPADWLE